ncbi:MAG: hypothetical protein FWG63_02830 [Defluviitaleaceae bacterium]|nr:hypothetical protein [Defluviitaleaceae bacterium]
MVVAVLKVLFASICVPPEAAEVLNQPTKAKPTLVGKSSINTELLYRFILHQ